MPKVSAAYRAARREEIAMAALRCIRRRGFSNTSIADVIAESGLSAGAIYSNFQNKAELAQFIAHTLVGGRIQALTDLVLESEQAMSPADVMITVLTALEDRDVPFEVLLQLWGEAALDPELHEIVSNTVRGLRASFQEAIMPWLRQTHPDDDDPDALGVAVARTMTTICQGYLARAAMFDEHDPVEYIESVTFIFST